MPFAMRLAGTSSSDSFSDAARLLMLLATNRAALILDCTQLWLSAICVGKPPNGTVHITEYRHALVMLHPNLLPRSFVNALLRNHVGLQDWGNNFLHLKVCDLLLPHLQEGSHANSPRCGGSICKCARHLGSLADRGARNAGAWAV